MKTVPLFEAKNRFSELVAAAERGDEVAITRRGVAVARLVAATRNETDAKDASARIRATFARLRDFRARVTLDGSIKDFAREGLD